MNWCPGPKGGAGPPRRPCCELGWRTHSKDWRRLRQAAGGTRSFGLSLSSGGPIWPARQPVARVQRTGVGPPGSTPPEARPPCTRPSGRERMVASSVIVTQSHSVKTTTFTYRLTPTRYPFIIIGGVSFPIYVP